MCNCGSKREYLTQQHSTATGIISPAEEYANHNKSANVRFEYIGNTALTVTGTITGRRYRFNSPGEVLQVDSRDASGLMLVPVLRKTLDA
ncbi:MAG: hypothetical protein J0I84_04125 [Terrimonas sp.]|nr:hypothetical protein [Terrimonas sp.]OJY81305.1 MAG: hypothetical protein BGP13_14980 [Sphingobacteriales bacterium 40-81]